MINIRFLVTLSLIASYIDFISEMNWSHHNGDTYVLFFEEYIIKVLMSCDLILSELSLDIQVVEYKF
jgi:hypothetical protein